MLTLRLVAALAIGSLVTPSLAQAPSPWRDLVVSGGAIQARGRLLVHYATNGSLQVFSAVTNEWHSHPPGLQTYPLCKDLLLLYTAASATAFSAYRGTFATVTGPSFGTMVASDSVVCVEDGSTLHTFSAFTGAWNTRPIPLGWVVEVGQRVALLRSNFAPNLAASAFDVFTGLWHDLPMQPAPGGGRVASGAVMLSTPQHHFAFSALRPGWAQAPNQSIPNWPGIFGDGDLVPNHSATFSGLTGTFREAPLGGMGTFGNLAFSGDAFQPFVLGAASNTWMAMTALSGVPTMISSNFAIRSGFGVMEVFNAHLDTVTTVPGSPGPLALNVATAVNGASTNVLSALTGQWQAPPPNTTSTHPADNSAVFATATGQLTGFAAPTGAMVPLAGSGFAVLNGYAAVNATTMAAFDALGARWLTLPRPAGAMQHAGGAQLLLATFPGEAIGYSVRGRRLASQPLAESGIPVVTDDVAYVRTANHVYAFSGLAESVTWQGDPIDAYGAARGTTARIQARVPTNHLVLLGFGPSLAAPLALPFGELWLDPAQAVTVFMPAAAGETRAILPVAIPNAPSLRGSMWLQQTITLAPTGNLYLGTPSTLFVQ